MAGRRRQIDDGLRAIVANAAMINAYREGVPDGGKPFPEGSAIVKIEWSKEKTPFSPIRRSTRTP